MVYFSFLLYCPLYLSYLIFMLQNAAKVPVLPWLLPRLEELSAPQPLPQRVLHQTSESTRTVSLKWNDLDWSQFDNILTCLQTWQGALLDDRPCSRVHV